MVRTLFFLHVVVYISVQHSPIPHQFAFMKLPRACMKRISMLHMLLLVPTLLTFYRPEDIQQVDHLLVGYSYQNVAR